VAKSWRKRFEGIPFLLQKIKAVFKDISLIKVLWQNLGTLVFGKMKKKQNQVLPSLGSKLLEPNINNKGTWLEVPL
jgi:glucose-6-phosphate 1-dehydrogenase